MIPVDTEAPTCGFCPTDIVIEETESSTRVNWDRPSCTDNSGVSPIVSSNIQSGALLSVPSDTEVQYTLADDEGNKFTGCKFRVTINSKYPSVDVEIVVIKKKTFHFSIN